MSRPGGNLYEMRNKRSNPGGRGDGIDTYHHRQVRPPTGKQRDPSQDHSRQNMGYERDVHEPLPPPRPPPPDLYEPLPLLNIPPYDERPRYGQHSPTIQYYTPQTKSAPVSLDRSEPRRPAPYARGVPEGKSPSIRDWSPYGTTNNKYHLEPTEEEPHYYDPDMDKHQGSPPLTARKHHPSPDSRRTERSVDSAPNPESRAPSHGSRPDSQRPWAPVGAVPRAPSSVHSKSSEPDMSTSSEWKPLHTSRKPSLHREMDVVDNAEPVVYSITIPNLSNNRHTPLPSEGGQDEHVDLIVRPDKRPVRRPSADQQPIPGRHRKPQSPPDAVDSAPLPTSKPITYVEERGVWDNKLQFLFAVIGYAVGLGNIWRFPYLVQRNGGGVFLIPYVILLALVGVPLLILEMGIGQRIRRGPWQAWYLISPKFCGVGISMVVCSLLTGCYYNTVITWCLFYLYNSFQSTLPWSECGTVSVGQDDEVTIDPECLNSDSASWFWNRETLNIASSIEDPNDGVSWRLLLCLLMAWLLVFFCTMRGFRPSCKVMYVTTIFPYIVLTVFLVRAVTLPGYEDGLRYLFVPDTSLLLNGYVWLDAASQILFTLSLSYGGVIALSSYVAPDNNIVVDAVIVAALNVFTSIYSAIIVFALVGYKANVDLIECENNKTELLMSLLGRTSDLPDGGEEVTITLTNEFGKDFENTFIMPNISNCTIDTYLESTAEGPGLAFITMTECITQFGVSAPFWAVLFFIMLLMLGLDSMFGLMMGILTSMKDLQLCNNVRTELLSGIVCFFSFLFGICFIGDTGEYVFQIFDTFAATLPLLIIALSELIAISYFYGLTRFSEDYQLMTGRVPSIYLLICWKFIGPVAIIFILVGGILQFSVDGGATYTIWISDLATTSTVTYPAWSQFVCFVITIFVVIWIPVLMVFDMMRMLTCYDDTQPGYFPEHGLKEMRNLGPYQPSQLKKAFFS